MVKSLILLFLDCSVPIVPKEKSGFVYKFFIFQFLKLPTKKASGLSLA